MKLARRKRHSGTFTLVEVAVALAVLAIGLTSILSVITTGLRWSNQIKVQTLAASTARAALHDELIGTKEKINGFWVTRSASSTYVINDTTTTKTALRLVTVTVFSDKAGSETVYELTGLVYE